MRYTVRIELRKPPEGDYDELHAAMEDEGFQRYAFDSPKALPTAEYAYTTVGGTQADVDAVRDLAVATAATVHPQDKVAALVTPVAPDLARRAFGLEAWHTDSS
jgi:hypothetical protein